jgi:hypothetical protein
MWYKEDVLKEGMACVIIHNMLVELKIQGNLAEECDELGLRMTADEVVHERYNDYCPHENSPNLNIASSNAENALINSEIVSIEVWVITMHFRLPS